MMIQSVKAIAARLLAILTISLAAFCVTYVITGYSYVLKILLLYLYFSLKLSKICCTNAIEKFELEVPRRKKYEQLLVIICMYEALLFTVLVIKL